MLTTHVKEIDPKEIVQRPARKLIRRTCQSPGPNYCWHVDEYDNLKPFGFPFYGKIDEHQEKLCH